MPFVARVALCKLSLSSGKTAGGMLFADDFVGVNSKESLQKLIDVVVYSYYSKWRLGGNVSNNAVMSDGIF